MEKLSIKKILQTGKNAELNTWSRSRTVNPNIEKIDNRIIVKTDDAETSISSYEEAMLQIVANFHFAPAWLVEDWIERSNVLSLLTAKEVILSWINVGLVWIEGSVTGEYLRPTEFLHKMFGIQSVKYTDIPFNQLTHTVCEQDIMFDVFTANKNNPLYENFDDIFIQKFSPLGLDTELVEGTNIIREGEFRNVDVYGRNNIDKLNDSENKIKEGMKAGIRVTEELKDFKKFILVQKHSNTGIVAKDYSFHLPDLIIPIPREEDGSPQSIAIEVELSIKSQNSYNEIMQRFKNNIKFGHIVYFTPNGTIVEALKNAYQQADGLGDTTLTIYEYTIPSMSSNYRE